MHTASIDNQENSPTYMRYVFPVCMALLMTYGMELYNHVLMGMGPSVELLLSPLSELLPIACAVLVVEKLAGGRIVAAVQGAPARHGVEFSLPEGMVMGIITCLAMCPLMSMVATLVFKHPTVATVLPIWFATFIRNLPFALVWSLIVARPVSQKIVRRVCA